MTTLPQHRFELLDGLRGVAALMVILYHVGETFATSPITQDINHGYLAVDFFFVLSGFVIGHAYDRRWSRGLTPGGFMLRRIIRLQPMVVIGVILGVISFIIQGCEKWDGTSVSTTAVLLSLVCGLLMLPSLPGTLPEVRGNGEMFPLNGPSWSLFFEYIGSLFYALFLHRFTTKWLAVFVAAAGGGLAAAAIGNASGFWHIGFGWSAADGGFWLGLLRMTFSFSAGMLMSRLFVMRQVRGAFWICSAMIVAALVVPYVGDGKASVLNGIYDSLCTLIVFPAVVWLGASGVATGAVSGRVCSFLGAVSYPVYIIHYPFMYLVYAWAWKNSYGFDQVWPVAAVLVPTVFILAWLFLKYYDIPVRSWLGRRLQRLGKS